VQRVAEQLGYVWSPPGSASRGMMSLKASLVRKKASPCSADKAELDRPRKWSSPSLLRAAYGAEAAAGSVPAERTGAERGRASVPENSRPVVTGGWRSCRRGRRRLGGDRRRRQGV